MTPEIISAIAGGVLAFMAGLHFDRLCSGFYDAADALSRLDVAVDDLNIAREAFLREAKEQRQQRENIERWWRATYINSGDKRDIN